MGMAALVLSCSLNGDGQEAPATNGDMTPLVSGARPNTAEPTSTATSDPPEGVASPVPTVADTAQNTMTHAPAPYLGQSSLEERILASPVIVRARLDAASSTVEYGRSARGMTYIATLVFSFSVLEHLKGSGGEHIAAVWNAGQLFDTRQEALASLPAIAVARDTSWDDREAIVFLQHSKTYLPSTQALERYYLSGERYFNNTLDDYYSIGSPYNKLWLPAASVRSQSGVDSQRFLLDVPPDTGEARTIMLGEVKARIAAVTAKLAASDGSEEYMRCVTESYFLERYERHRKGIGRELLSTSTRSNVSPPHVHQISSGLAAGSVVYRVAEESEIAPDVPVQLWLDSGDESFFDAATSSLDFGVSTSRPLIERIYNFYFNHRGPFYSQCDGWAIRYEWTVSAISPDGVLHEAFFDPVTVGSAVAADGANGVLKPATFAGANGAPATIERIAWETGTVSIELSPHTGISGHAVDFIALDGSVSLSLNVADATVDAANNTLSWPAASQPWHSGDKLMVRIREAPDCSTGAVTDTSANSGLAGDCEILLVVMDTLRGTATLNWNATTTITAWAGVTVSGTPSRVTRLELANEGLDGSIPEYLGRLLGLTHLNLSRNSLTGHIPAELGGLSNLETLRLSGNSFTGCIPLALRSVPTNDLSLLNLLYCRPPAPGNLTAGTPAETSVPLSWHPVPNAGTYRVEYRSATSTEWLVDVDNATTTSHIVDNLTCGTDYRFRVSALGVGTVYAPEWSEPSEPMEHTTEECNLPPEFATSTYSSTVAENATTTDLVGTVSATDADSDPVSHAITSGNSAGRFAIATSTGDVTAAGELDHESVPSYTLVVEARDDRDGVATTTVEIEVTDVAEDAPPAPTGLGVTLADGHVHGDLERRCGRIGVRASAAGDRFWRRLGRGRDHRRVDADVQSDRRACVRHDLRVQGACLR